VALCAVSVQVGIVQKDCLDASSATPPAPAEAGSPCRCVRQPASDWQIFPSGKSLRQCCLVASLPTGDDGTVVCRFIVGKKLTPA